jgi:hypothetical protein
VVAWVLLPPCCRPKPDHARANDADLDRHAAAAVARPTGRGWRLDKSERGAQIDAVVGLAMAVERAEVKPAPVALVGWL